MCLVSEQTQLLQHSTMDTKHSVDIVQCSQGESFYSICHLSTFVDKFLHLHKISYVSSKHTVTAIK